LNIQVKNLDHLGIVAGIIDQIGLVEEIDRQIESHPQQIISTGQVVKAMILNGLGFVSAPLYLFSEFFIGKATEHLLGEGIKPEHLNDDRIGRALDSKLILITTEQEDQLKINLLNILLIVSPLKLFLS
jgi:transposase